MMRSADVKKRLTLVGKACSHKTDKICKIFNYYNKEVLDDGSTKEKSIKGKKR